MKCLLSNHWYIGVGTKEFNDPLSGLVGVKLAITRNNNFYFQQLRAKRCKRPCVQHNTKQHVKLSKRKKICLLH